MTGRPEPNQYILREWASTTSITILETESLLQPHSQGLSPHWVSQVKLFRAIREDLVRSRFRHVGIYRSLHFSPFVWIVLGNIPHRHVIVIVDRKQHALLDQARIILENIVHTGERAGGRPSLDSAADGNKENISSWEVFFYLFRNEIKRAGHLITRTICSCFFRPFWQSLWIEEARRSCCSRGHFPGRTVWKVLVHFVVDTGVRRQYVPITDINAIQNNTPDKVWMLA